MPRQGRFFEQFEAHGQTFVDGADALARLLQGGPDIAEYCRQIQDHEHKADDIIREVLLDVRRTFITPFDRSAIRSEEHTSELQSLMRISYAVFCLKKKKNK